MSDDDHHQTPRVSPENISRHLPMVLNPDGSITRLPSPFPDVEADPNSPSSPVLTKDVPLNPTNNTWLRLFLPRTALDNNTSSTNNKKLPLIVYFHGGGFIVCSAANSFFHRHCADIALHVPAIVVSVEYRLAPEHRLPAAYDDAVDALRWIRTSTDEWIAGFADLSNCFLMGTSAGANIAYHGGLRAVHDLGPLQIRGLILSQPYFCGSKRTPSELRLVNDERLPLFINDLLWDLSFPDGCDRDHKYSNPTVDEHSLNLLRSLGWAVVVTGSDGDPLIDRQREFAKVLTEKGVPVVCVFHEMGYHGNDLLDEKITKRLFQEITKLVHTPKINHPRSNL